MQAAPLRRLGKTGAEVPAIGVGTNRWSYGANDAPVFETYQALVEAGGGFIDTAEIYGFGKSERLIGECIRKDGRPVFVASKFAPFLVRTSPGSLMAALDATLARLGLASIDLYYVHFPFPFVDLGDFADGLAETVKSGKARHVGVSNFNADQMRRVADRLARSNIPLAANEVQYSLAHRNPETNGLLEACRELDIALVAYFPLASGRLAGPTADAKPDKLDAVRRALAEVAQAHQASQSQVALNWLLARDPCVIPIPGATKAHHAKANLGALEWRLTDEEFALLDAASAPAK
ncbi:MAG TPA: aldo/keto reductase [Caulobacteraceae bacterium]|jgi:aryl-alcohol dehydrogenase-like predicted oxidoreductase|nr:aldo/keto reductase [Caulobacteraceae bacterium]